TLTSRELTAGWCEAVKQGAVGDRRLFDRTVRVLHLLQKPSKDRGFGSGGDKSQTDVCATIAAHCRFKASIVAGDERENPGREDSRSRRILNFGHTTAHALEAVTGYRRFPPCEAGGGGKVRGRRNFKKARHTGGQRVRIIARGH